MHKRLTKPYERNVRLEAPTGLIGVPPDSTAPLNSNPETNKAMFHIPIGCRRGTHERFL